MESRTEERKKIEIKGGKLVVDGKEYSGKMVIPNDQEIKYAAETGLSVGYNTPIAAKVRKITEANLGELKKSNITKEQYGLQDTVRRYPDYEFVPVFQFKKGIQLTSEQLEVIEKAQQINETNFITFYPKSLKEDAEDYKQRLSEFKNRNKDKTILPVLDPAEKNLSNLRKKTLAVISEELNQCIVLYRHYTESGWQQIMPLLKTAKIYVITTGVLPRMTRKDKYCLLGAPFIFDVDVTCHALPWSGGKSTNHFLEPDWSYKDTKSASKGLVDYGGQHRNVLIQGMQDQFTKYKFTRTDTILQANKLCEDLTRSTEILTIVRSVEGLRHFAENAGLI